MRRIGIFLFAYLCAAAPAGAQYPYERLVNLNPGAPDGVISVTKVGNLAFFFPEASPVGRELWVTDGTPGGTHFTKDITPGAGPAGFYHIILDFNGIAYFGYALPGEDFNLYRSDGTEGGTELVFANMGLAAGFPMRFEGKTATQFFFRSQAAAGGVLYASDGTQGGTEIVSPPGLNVAFLSVATNNGLVFVASDDAHGSELWVTEGTPGTTRILQDFIPGPGSSPPGSIFWDGEKLYAVFADGTFGEELFVSDTGLTQLTRLTDLRPNSADGVDFFTEWGLLNGMTYFGGFPLAGLDEELCRSDGTAGNSGLFAVLFDGSNGSSPEFFLTHGDQLYFRARSGTHGQEFFRTDGTPGNIELVTDINPNAGDSSPLYLTPITTPQLEDFGKFALAGFNENTGQELYISDGTPAGTTLMADVNFDFGSSSPNNLILLGDKLVFTAFQPGEGQELFALTLPTRAGARDESWTKYR